nr:DUF2804 family protein [Patulibacter sp. SYSU D01012]
MPLVHAGRVRKRWRYVGVYGPELSVCVGLVRLGPIHQSFWAVWDREGRRLHERTRRRDAGVRLPDGAVHVRDGAVEIDLRLDLDAIPAVETVTPYGRAYAWTSKRAAVPVRGTVRAGGRTWSVDALGVVDDSGGYPPRHTAWCWSAGVGTDEAGRTVGWNLVRGIHDDPAASERTVWIDGQPQHVAPVRFAEDLSAVTDAAGGAAAGDAGAVGAGDARAGDAAGARPVAGAGAAVGAGAAANGPGGRGPAVAAGPARGVDLRFAAEATRARRDEALVVRSAYEQPFGTFTGTLPGGVRLAEAHGVMERHTATW